MGKLEVTVCAARNLHNMQHFGVPDPFCRLISGDKQYKTKVVKDSLSPEWNETFRFQVADEMGSQIRFEIWNKCTYDDDLMGIYTLSVGGLTRGIVRDEWYVLDKSKTQADIHIRILALDFGFSVKADEQWMVTTDINRDPVKRAIEDGTWRPGKKTPPPPSGPPQQQQQQYVQSPQVQQPQQQPIQYAQAPPPSQQAQYASQPPLSQQQPQVVYVQAPLVQQPQQQLQSQYVQAAYPQPQMQQPQYVQTTYPQQPYAPPQVPYQVQYPQAPLPPQQCAQPFFPQQQPQGYYAPAPGYRY
ncbi:extended synaptotagmin-1-like [Bactrocera neohumeralis]|uniref:extended synaptotagmin-1-like n=1 Tax=Bactrocera neohumeralis TaxID=98809 RepID=UPI002165E789|nr:extended synaptotagmin-1-like [Bactrocera neohumeralis]